MNRFKIIVPALLAASISLSATAKPQYIPSQLTQFEKTGTCAGCDLSETNLSYQSHDNADLNHALLVKASLSSSNFNTANFSHAQLMYASLNSLRASGSNFTSTNLTQSDLRNANFSSADFSNAILSGADLSNANLAWANISKEQLATAKSLSCTILPDGTRHPADNGNSC